MDEYVAFDDFECHGSATGEMRRRGETLGDAHPRAVAPRLHSMTDFDGGRPSSLHTERFANRKR